MKKNIKRVSPIGIRTHDLLIMMHVHCYCATISALLHNRLHILTTKDCAKKLKKLNLHPVPITDPTPDTEDDDVTGNAENRISEIYLERDHNVAIILLSSPEVTAVSRKQHRKRPLGFKVDSPLAPFPETDLQTFGLDPEEEPRKSRPVECSVSQNFSRAEMDCAWNRSVVRIRGWPIVANEKTERRPGQPRVKKQRRGADLTIAMGPVWN